MKIYCGTDIIEVERIKDAIFNVEGFKEKVFSKEEIKIGEQKKEKTRYEYYAGRFAAKEAIYKAVSNIKNDFCFWEVEIIGEKENKNRPAITFFNKELETLKNCMKIDVDVSISHIKEYAVAMAVIKDNRDEV